MDSRAQNKFFSESDRILNPDIHKLVDSKDSSASSKCCSVYPLKQSLSKMNKPNNKVASNIITADRWWQGSMRNIVAVAMLLAAAVLVSSWAVSSVLTVQQYRNLELRRHIEEIAALNTIGQQCSVNLEVQRFDCYPNSAVTEQDCVARGCCWNASAAPGAPWCYYPRDYSTFQLINSTVSKRGLTAYFRFSNPSHYPGDFRVARLDAMYLSDSILRIKIYDAEHARWEVPIPALPVGMDPHQPLYRLLMTPGQVGFTIVRSDTNTTLLSSTSGLGQGTWILSDKLLQISLLESARHMYGLGERRGNLQLNLNWTTIPIFNKDLPPTDNINLYGTQPMYLGMEEDGRAHGVFLPNSNAMDVALQSLPAVTFRSTGGVIDLLVMLGPTPASVVAQYTEAVGRPMLPPYWSLGFHLCKFGYGSINRTREVWKRNRDAGLPFDVQWNDIDYMQNNNDFTWDRKRFAKLPAFVDELHKHGMHYMLILDPGVSASEVRGSYPPYDRGIELDIFIKNSSNLPLVGKVWNRVSTVWPDFTHPNAPKYWEEQVAALHKHLRFDGLWLDMNEPSNFADGTLEGSCAPENLTYRPLAAGGVGSPGLRTHTLCMDARHYAGTHFNVHSIHATTQVKVSYDVLASVRDRRPFIISRASSPGLGHWGGHWSGDVASSWEDLAASIPAMLSFSLWGVPMIGADICGFRGNTTHELCRRWMELGAFYPFSRNHNSNDAIDQDPAGLGGEVLSASIRALRLRYTLLPYYYTLFWRAHAFGKTVARPVFFAFPKDPKALQMEYQFMIGPHIMVTPILQPGVNTTLAYYPGTDPWYDFATGTKLAAGGTERITPDNMTVAIRGGAVVPLQRPALDGAITTTRTRSTPLQLLIAPSAIGSAVGELYWDDGDSIDSYTAQKYTHLQFLVANSTALRSAIHYAGFELPPLGALEIYGVSKPPTGVLIGGIPCNCTIRHDAKLEVLEVSGLNLKLNVPLDIKWPTSA